jgi:hypothetical protein
MKNLFKMGKLKKKKESTLRKFTKMEEDTLVSYIMAKEMEKVHSIIKMEAIIKVNGKTI